MRLVAMGAVLKSLQTVVLLMSYTRRIKGDNTVTSLMNGRVFVT